MGNGNLGGGEIVFQRDLIKDIMQGLPGSFTCMVPHAVTFDLHPHHEILLHGGQISFHATRVVGSQRKVMWDEARLGARV